MKAEFPSVPSIRLGGEVATVSPAADAGPSWQSRCFNRLFRLLGVKQQMASADAVHDWVARLALRPVSHQPKGLGRGVMVTRKDEHGWPVYHTARTTDPGGCNYVMFLHGGGYINEIERAHWRFIGLLTREAGVRCVVPIYPLAPDATAKLIVPRMGEILRRLMDDIAPARLTLIGNSAGAGMALAAAQWLRHAGYRQPDAMVLISPGVNAVVNRPEQAALAALDPILDIPGLLEVGRLYAGDLDVAHPYVSPLNGEFPGLAPMIVFSGTHDLLYPDSVDLVAKARSAGVPVQFHLREGQPHNYAALPTPEGRQAREIILRTAALGSALDLPAP